jgi:hypothetical protein
MVVYSKKYSPLDFIRGVRNRNDFLIILGRILERCHYSADGTYEGVKPTKVTEIMEGLSHPQYSGYKDLAIKLGLLKAQNGGFVRTDDGQSVLNNLYHIGTIFQKNNNSNNGHKNPSSN